MNPKEEIQENSPFETFPPNRRKQLKMRYPSQKHGHKMDLKIVHLRI